MDIIVCNCVFYARRIPRLYVLFIRFLKIMLEGRGFYSILAVFCFLLVHNDFSWILEHKVDRFDFGNWHMWCTLFTDNLWCFQVRGVASRAIHMVKSRKSYSYEIASGCYVWWWAGIITFKLGVIPGQMVIWRPVCSATVLLTYFFFLVFQSFTLSFWYICNGDGSMEDNYYESPSTHIQTY